MKLALVRTATGKEDRVTSAAEDKFIRVTSCRNSSPNKCFNINCSEELLESGLDGRIAAKKPLLKDTNKKQRLARAKKDKQLTID